MKQKTQESYQEWMSGLEAKLASKPDKLAQFKSLVEDEDVKPYVVSSVMAEKEFYRRLNDVNEKERGLTTLEADTRKRYDTVASDAIRLQNWFNEVEPHYKTALAESQSARAERDAAIAQLRDLGLEVPNVSSKPGSDSVTTDSPLWGVVQALESRLQRMDQAMPVVAEQILALSERAREEGFRFDPKQLISTASQKNVDLLGAYEDITRDQRTAKASADLDKALAKAREEGERQALTRLSSPDRLGATRARVDGFSAGDGAAKLTSKADRLDKAMQEYMNLDGASFSGF